MNRLLALQKIRAAAAASSKATKRPLSSLSTTSWKPSFSVIGPSSSSRSANLPQHPQKSHHHQQQQNQPYSTLQYHQNHKLQQLLIKPSNSFLSERQQPQHSQQQQQQHRPRIWHSSMAEALAETKGDSLQEPASTSPPTPDTTITTTPAFVRDAQDPKKVQHQAWARLSRIRNIGILAHVDAGKTTVTERMLALAGVVRQVGRVDTGNTVTDFLPQERERGITIQSAAIRLEWGWHHAHYHTTSAVDLSVDTQDRVHIHLIDTPGHVDFSVEVHRSVAVLDGAVLVVDAVAGVQAQTETVWRAMRESASSMNHGMNAGGHTALPSLVVINKMDKEGCDFRKAIQSIHYKLPGANPLPIQIPLFRVERPPSGTYNNCFQLPHIIVEGMPLMDGEDDDDDYYNRVGGEFVGVLDLIHMRAIVYPETTSNSSKSVEDCIPDVYPLLLGGGSSTSQQLLDDNVQDALIDPDCPITQAALRARHALVEQLAGDCQDELMEEYYLEDAMPSPKHLQQAVRQATLNRKALPVLAAAALRGKGVEPLLDAIADLLPSPLDRPAPALMNPNHMDDPKQQQPAPKNLPATTTSHQISLGHPLHQDMLAFAFKVCHLSGGRGGSGDGRVVFCRVYSGTLSERDVLHVISPPTKGVTTTSTNNEQSNNGVRKERVGGMLELKGCAFTNKADGVCHAGEVCALVGLKSVRTGDTLVLAKKKTKKNGKQNGSSGDMNGMVCLAGVSSPKPVLTVRLEAETQQEQTRLSECLQLLVIEDPSLHVEESDAGTLLSGLGELHVEITLDRLQREFGLAVQKGNPRVAYRETLTYAMETPGGDLLQYDRTLGDTRLQGAVHLRLEPASLSSGDDGSSNSLIDEDETRVPLEPTISVGPQVLEFLQLKPGAPHEVCMAKCPVYKALVQGCLGALRRGPLGSYALANVHCHVEAIDAEQGYAGLQALPGAIRAAAMNAVATTMSENIGNVRVLEPSMSVEISLPNEMVGPVLSDLTSRRGIVEDVLTEDEDGKASHQQKTLVRGQVPLVEILGYANILRSLTAGEGNFTAEYKGHSACSEIPH